MTRAAAAGKMPAMLASVLTWSRLPLAAAFAAATAWAAARTGPARLDWPWAALLLALAALIELTDMLDGYVARRRGTANLLGGLADPLCDSLSRLTVYFAVALAGWLPLAVPLVMVVRDIVVAYVRIVHAHAGGRTSARLSGKLKAIVQGAGILAVVVLAAVGASWAEPARTAVGLGVIAVTLWSLYDYARSGLASVAALRGR